MSSGGRGVPALYCPGRITEECIESENDVLERMAEENVIKKCVEREHVAGECVKREHVKREHVIMERVAGSWSAGTL